MKPMRFDIYLGICDVIVDLRKRSVHSLYAPLGAMKIIFAVAGAKFAPVVPTSEDL
jgi:hypothetical protein